MDTVTEISTLLSKQAYKEILSRFAALARDPSSGVDLIRIVAQAAFLDANPREAESILSTSVDLYLKDPAYLHDLGLYQSRLGKFEEAEKSLLLSLEQRPDYAATLLLLGNVLKSQLKLSEAINAFESAIKSDPDNTAARNNLATTLVRVGRYAEAEKIYQSLLSLNDYSLNTEYNYANLLNLSGRQAEALAYYDRILSRNPQLFAAWNNAGQVLQSLGRLTDADRYFQQASSLDPNSAELKLNRGKLSHLKGDWRSAAKLSREVAEQKSDLSALAKANLCYVLNNSDELTSQDLFNQHKELYLQLSDKFPPSSLQRRKNVKPRIGYLSADFRAHSVAFFIEGLMRTHSKEKFDIFIYANQAVEDNVTKRFLSYGHSWRWVKHFEDSELLEQIRLDNLDILVDLAGLTAGHRAQVFAQRAAAIQINYLGYPHSSGIPNMDYRVVDSMTDPDSADCLATEKLLRLDPCFICYQPSSSIKPANQTSGETPFIYGCFNAVAKLSDQLLLMWAKILQAVPDSKLLLKSHGLQDPQTSQTIINRFQALNIPASRLILKDFIPSSDQHLALYEQVNLALDSYPYCGTTTTCEALSMAVPVLTLCGDRHSARVGASLLNAVNLQDLIAYSEDEYVAKAISLSAKNQELSRLRQFLIDNFKSSVLCDQDAFTERWEKMLLDLCSDLLRVGNEHSAQ